MPLVEVENLSKVYRKGTQEVPVLRDLNLSVGAGEFLALMGPSGSGKTTLLNLIAGIDRPTAGAIRVGGQDLSQLSRNKLAAWRANHVGYVFQLYNLIPVLTAFENVELPLLLLPLSRAERRKRVEIALGDRRPRASVRPYPRQLGRTGSRVAIARACRRPDDHRGRRADRRLDAETTADATLNLLTRLNEEMGKTLVMVTTTAAAAGQAARDWKRVGWWTTQCRRRSADGA